MNKIVEILEKAKSCYWPALQNVYLNVTEGEWWGAGLPDADRGAPEAGVLLTHAPHTRPRPAQA